MKKDNKKKLSSSTRIKDEIGHIKGKVAITIIDAKTNKPIKKVDVNNIAVNNLRTQISRLLAGDFTGDVSGDEVTRYIYQVAFGTSGVAETVDDELITSPVLCVIDTVSYPTTSSVKFEAEMDVAVGNGTTFQEVGLLFLDPAPFLAARTAFSAIQKSSKLKLNIEWTLSFS